MFRMHVPDAMFWMLGAGYQPEAQTQRQPFTAEATAEAAS
jgi:hypothetical protein